jgi:hypothetical protein
VTEQRRWVRRHPRTVGALLFIAIFGTLGAIGRHIDDLPPAPPMKCDPWALKPQMSEFAVIQMCGDPARINPPSRDENVYRYPLLGDKPTDPPRPATARDRTFVYWLAKTQKVNLYFKAGWLESVQIVEGTP